MAILGRSLVLARSTRAYLSITNRCLATATQENAEKVKSFDEIPGPKKLPLLGSVFRKREKILLEDFDNLVKEYGPIVSEVIINQKLLYVSDPNFVSAMHRNEGKYPNRGPGMLLETIYCKKYGKTNTLASLEREDWYNARYGVQTTLMKPKSAMPFLPGQAAVADDFVERMRKKLDANNEIPEYQQELFKYALEAVCILTFDKRLGCLDDNIDSSDAQKLFSSLEQILLCFDEAVQPKEFILLSINHKLSPVFKRHKIYADAMREVKDKFLNEALERLKSDDVTEKPRFLKYILEEAKLPFNYVDIIITSMILAGVDSTANTLSWLLYQLAKHQEPQDKLREEVNKNIPRHGKADEKMFNNMPYLKACLKEVFRIVPPFPTGMPRVMPEDVVIDGYQIPKGTMIMPLTHQMCKSEKYFNEPEKYLPDRWVRGDSREDIHPFLLLPFGHGSRSCLGRRFAEQEIYLALAKIIQNFKVEYHHEDIGYQFKTFIRPDKPLRFKFIPL